MADDRSKAYGIFLLRVALGAMFIAHSVIHMLMTLTLAGTAKFFAELGLPEFLAYATFLAEAIGGALLILGVKARWVALALSPILLGAIWAHAGNGWIFTAPEGGWEYPLSTSSFFASRSFCSATVPSRSRRHELAGTARARELPPVWCDRCPFQRATLLASAPGRLT